MDIGETLKKYRTDYLLPKESMATRLGLTKDCYCALEDGSLSPLKIPLSVLEEIESLLGIVDKSILNEINRLYNEYKKQEELDATSVDNRIQSIEYVAGGPYPGTSFARTYSNNELKWTLAIGDPFVAKKYFSGETIVDCLEKAEKFYGLR